MGIKEILTTPLGFGGTTLLSWNEPFLYRVRLRGDLWKRLVVVAAMWGAAIGVLLILFSFNVHEPGIGLAIGLGAVFGLGPALGVLFWRQKHVNGKVEVRQDELRKNSMSWGVGYRIGQWAGKQRVALVTPFFDTESRDVPNALFADDGYAVGAIRVDADNLVNAMQPVFMKNNGNGVLDPSGSDESEWIGTPSGDAPKELSGNGERIVGLHGRGAAVLDAVGIVLAPSASSP